MPDITFSGYDYCIFIAMLLISTLIGVYYAWSDRNTTSYKEYLLGGKRLSVFPVAMSINASFVSGVFMLGFPVEVYTRGTGNWMMIFTTMFAMIVTAEIFVPIFYNLNITSVNEYLLKRYKSNFVRLLGSLSFLLCALPYLGIVLYTPSLALETVTNLSLHTSVVLIGTICTFYTAIGGLKAVILTDVVQYILMIGGLLAVVIKGTIDAGGINESYQKANTGDRINFFSHNIDIYSSSNSWTILIGTLVLFVARYGIDQMQIQRTCSLPTINKAKGSIYLAIPGFSMVHILATYAGVVAYANFYDCDPIQSKVIQRPDQLMPYFVAKLFGNNFPGIPGLFVAAVFSGCLSTLSSGYNAIATILWEDFLKHFLNLSKTGTVRMTRLLAALVGIMSVAIAFIVSKFGTIFQAVIAITGSIQGPLLSVFVVGMVLPQVTALSASFGLLTGQLFCIFITIGALIHKRPADMLPTTTVGCDHSNVTLTDFSVNNLLSNATTIPYRPEGLDILFHISPYFVPFVGFIVSSSVNLFVCLVLGKLSFCKFIESKLISNNKCIATEMKSISRPLVDN